MGLCPSRQSNVKTVESKTYLKPTQTQKQNLPKEKVHKWEDAEPFVQRKNDGPKQPWEMYLEGKATGNRRMQRNNFSRGTDGQFTSEYRRLLGNTAASGTATYKQFGPEAQELLKAYRDKPRAEPKRKQTSLKKAVLAGRTTNPLQQKFEQFDEKVRRLEMHAANNLKALVALPSEKIECKDDSATVGHMPYGLADRCYLSDSEETAREGPKKAASRHVSSLHAPIREYVTQEITPGVEAALVALLYRLRQLRDQEAGCGMKRKRYAVGFREATRSIASGVCRGVVLAPDVDRTQNGVLEEKMQRLVNDCKAKGIPVIFGLSRRQLGYAIQKSVTVSVLSIEDVRGAVEQFELVQTLVQKK